MKKVVSFAAICLMVLGMTSCEAETSLDETEALYDIELQANDDDENASTDKGGN